MEFNFKKIESKWLEFWDKKCTQNLINTDTYEPDSLTLLIPISY